MNFKKIILSVFIILALNFSYQPANNFFKLKESIVLILESENDFNTNEFIKKNEAKAFNTLVSLTLMILYENRSKFYFNSS